MSLDLNTRLQDLVEDAGHTLRRPVAVDDRHLRLLAHTMHPRGEELDEVRLTSVLKQEFMPELVDWLRLHGIESETGPVVIPANERIGLRSRVCFPIRCQGYLLGYLWLIDADHSLGSADLAKAADIAEKAGIVLYRDMLLRDLDRRRERACLRDLLSSERRVRQEAIDQLREFELFAAEGPFAVVVTRLPAESPGFPAESIRLACDALMMRSTRTLAPTYGLHLLRGDHGLLLVSLADPKLRADGAGVVARELRDELAREFPAEQRLIVGIGGAARDLDGVPASYAQALRTLDVAETIASFGEVVAWDDLGIYGMLVELPIDQIAPAIFPSGLHQLLAAPGGQVLLQTLECYLDNAGDAKETASALFLHRTTLWKRLRRIERIADVDLGRGGDRLSLHLALKLARLKGWALDAAPPASKSSSADAETRSG